MPRFVHNVRRIDTDPTRERLYGYVYCRCDISTNHAGYKGWWSFDKDGIRIELLDDWDCDPYGVA